MLEEQNKPEQQPAPPQPPQETPAPPARSNRNWIAIAIGGGCALLACLAVAAALLLRVIAPPLMNQFDRLIAGSAGATAPASYPPQNANTMGDPKAPVKIIEYADFQCPYCRAFWQETEPQIVATYVKTGKVYYEYRSVGAFIGPESASAAEAAYCAGDQGKFWQYHDLLYTNWTGENVGDFSSANLRKFATSLGLDQTAFNACLSSGKYVQRLQADVTNARSAGVRATPSFLINGKLIKGAQPFSVFQQAIEAALQGK
ncbi:MAG TPA: DsbA family protein [Anaerolineales bacterium]